MMNNQADPTNMLTNWIFNLVLQLAASVCLSILALSLIVGVSPLTALLRSGAAFVVFALLGWAVSLVWVVPKPKEATVESDDLAHPQPTLPDDTSGLNHQPGDTRAGSDTGLAEEAHAT